MQLNNERFRFLILSMFADDTKLGGVVGYQNAVLPFSVTWTGWKVGQRGT